MAPEERIAELEQEIALLHRKHKEQIDSLFLMLKEKSIEVLGAKLHIKYLEEKLGKIE
jgi:uncharacterized coiled-coil protein SlyX